MTEYRDKPVTPGQQALDFTQSDDPFGLFARWMEEAIASEPVDPNAMAVATVDADGLPNVRMILLKGADERGFVFYTNCGSAKGQELVGEAKAALLFYWKSLHRQIRIRGRLQKYGEAAIRGWCNAHKLPWWRMPRGREDIRILTDPPLSIAPAPVCGTEGAFPVDAGRESAIPLGRPRKRGREE